MGAAKRDWERYEDLKNDVAKIAFDTGALRYDDEGDVVCAFDANSERHAYARATVLCRSGRLCGTLDEIKELMKESLDSVRFGRGDS